MTKISDLSEELLVKILSFLPTKVAVSTSILSKQWEFLWMWLPNLEFGCAEVSVRDFINKNLPLHRAPIINSLCLRNLRICRAAEAENFKSWVEIAISRGVHELTCISYSHDYEVVLVLPDSLYTCKSLVTLKLMGELILVDVPQMVCLPSLKTVQLAQVTYSNEDSLPLFLSFSPVLEDLIMIRHWKDNMRALVIKVPSLQRLTLFIQRWCSSDRYEIVTPSLKYLRLDDYRSDRSYLIEHMPKLEEAFICLLKDNDIEDLLKSITTVKRLSLRVTVNSGNETVYGNGIFFGQLENLTLYIFSENWSKILFQLLKDSPNLQILDLCSCYQEQNEYKPVSWNNNESSVPICLLKSLKTFKLEGHSGEQEEERDFLSFIFKHARCLESISILPDLQPNL